MRATHHEKKCPVSLFAPNSHTEKRGPSYSSFDSALGPVDARSRRGDRHSEASARFSPSAQKSPRKGCVPGGQRTLYFSGSDWTFRDLPTKGSAARGSSATASSCTRSAPLRLPCRRHNAPWSAGTGSYARPQMQTRIKETSRPPALAHPWAKLRLTHEGARIWNIPNRVKGGFSKRRKFLNFAVHAGPAEEPSFSGGRGEIAGKRPSQWVSKGCYCCLSSSQDEFSQASTAGQAGGANLSVNSSIEI